MNFSENRPIYIQISDYFCDQILSQDWKPGDRIPSVREVAVQMEVNPNTAIRAFHNLQEEGVLYNQRGVGYFVDEDAEKIVKEKRRKEFIQQKLPILFKEMDLLGFSFQDLEEIYKSKK
jgi:GntR family transcriptional regulator